MTTHLLILILLATFSSVYLEQKALSIVFDTTQSMTEEWESVKKAMKFIIQRHITKNKPAVNLLVVPFNDPNAGPVLRFQNEKMFFEEIDKIKIHGGGDCPEKALTGILYALGNGSQSSNIYVFTDASAKDYGLLDEVLKLVRRKQSQVNIIKTDTCGSYEKKIGTYERIVQVSSGMIYNVPKEDVVDIIPILKASVEEDRISILKDDEAPPQRNKYKFPVDLSLTEVTIQVSIPEGELILKVNLFDPKGNEVKEGEKLTRLLKSSKTTYIGILHNPSNGIWKLMINTKSGLHTVRIYGNSKAKFNLKFGPVKKTNSYFYDRPVEGAKSYVFTNASQPLETMKLRIKNRLSNKTALLNMKALDSSRKSYVSQNRFKFEDEQQSYDIQISGEWKKGDEFERYPDIAIIPQKTSNKLKLKSAQGQMKMPDVSDQQPNLNKDVSDQPDLNKDVSDQPDLNKDVSDQPDLNKDVSDQPDLNKDVSDQPNLNKDVSDQQPDLNNDISDQQPDLNKDVSDQPDLNKDVSDQPDYKYVQYHLDEYHLDDCDNRIFIICCIFIFIFIIIVILLVVIICRQRKKTHYSSV